jgi:hypothetical protein
MSGKIPNLILIVAFILHSPWSNAQNSFIEPQRSSFRVSGVFNSKEDTLQKEFESKGLKWPARYVYIRSFKYDAQLEVWVKNEAKEKYAEFARGRIRDYYNWDSITTAYIDLFKKVLHG